MKYVNKIIKLQVTLVKLPHMNKLTNSSIFISPEILSARIKTKPSLGEFFGLMMAVGILMIFSILRYQQEWITYDFDNYIGAPLGIYVEFYYHYWIIPILSIFEKLPGVSGYVVWGLINIFGVWFAARVFSSRPGFVLLTYQMFYALSYGQITGILLGGLAFFWWALINNKWILAGLGLLIASTKFQIGIPIGLTLILLVETSWKNRLQTLVIPLGITILSLILYPLWPLDLVDAILYSDPPDAQGSIALWQWIGPWALLLWIPPITIKYPKEQRRLLLISATCLALPYFQQTDLLVLFAFPIHWGYILLGNLGYLFIEYQWKMLPILSIIPMMIYIKNLIPRREILDSP